MLWSHAKDFAERGVNVARRRDIVPFASGDARPGHHQGDVAHLGEDRNTRLAPGAASVAEVVAVVGEHDDGRVFPGVRRI